MRSRPWNRFRVPPRSVPAIGSPAMPAVSTGSRSALAPSHLRTTVPEEPLQPENPKMRHTPGGNAHRFLFDGEKPSASTALTVGRDRDSHTIRRLPRRRRVLRDQRRRTHPRGVKQGSGRRRQRDLGRVLTRDRLSFNFGATEKWGAQGREPDPDSSEPRKRRSQCRTSRETQGRFTRSASSGARSCDERFLAQDTRLLS